MRLKKSSLGMVLFLAMLMVLGSGDLCSLMRELCRVGEIQEER